MSKLLPKGEKLPKRARLTKRSEFTSLSRGGKKLYTRHFLVITGPNDRETGRLGLSVSAKVGKAVVRNRVKRFLREFFRRHGKPSPGDRDYLIIARNGAGDLSYHDVVRELEKFPSSQRSGRRHG